MSLSRLETIKKLQQENDARHRDVYDRINKELPERLEYSNTAGGVTWKCNDRGVVSINISMLGKSLTWEFSDDFLKASRDWISSCIDPR